MSALASGVAAEITRLHDLAHHHADAAVEHAVQAGRLLLQTRAEVGHGNWLSWLKENVKFTSRTAQRYMNAAAPRPKSDRLSYSPGLAKTGKKAERVRTELAAIQHRDDVVSHATLLIAELPTVSRIRPEDVGALRRLRDQIDAVLALEATDGH